MHKMFKTAFIANLVICSSSYAAVPITPGNVAQKVCPIGSRLTSLKKHGTVVGGGSASAIVKDKKLGVGKPLNKGDVVYYVSMVEANKTYTTEKQVEIIDGSPLTPDVTIVPGQNYPIVGSFFSKDGRKYDMIPVGSRISGFLALVDDTGYLCSNRLNQKLEMVGMPTVYQQLPLKSVVEQIGSQPRITSVAVIFTGSDGATFSYEYSLMLNGRVLEKKSLSFDLFSGIAQIGDLRISMEKSSNGGVLAKSIEEPSDYHLWFSKLRSKKR